MLYIQLQVREFSEFFGKKTGFCVWCVAGVVYLLKKLSCLSCWLMLLCPGTAHFLTRFLNTQSVQVTLEHVIRAISCLWLMSQKKMINHSLVLQKGKKKSMFKTSMVSFTQDN